MEFTQEQLKLMEPDLGSPGETLDAIYNPDGDGEHPQIGRAQWRTAVANEETISGYWDWVAYQIGVAFAPDPLRDADTSALRVYMPGLTNIGQPQADQ